MRILGLLSSDVRGGDGRIADSALFPQRMRAPLAAALGEEVEIVAREVWPDEQLIPVVERWMARHEPDLVMLGVSGFWFLYESIPARLQRYGPLGRVAARGLLALAATPWLAHNRAFRSGRSFASRIFPGASYFEPDEVIERCEEVIRTVLRAEGSYLVVVAPSMQDGWARDEASRVRLMARRDRVESALAAFCNERKVEFWGSAMFAQLRDPRGRSVQGDGLHLDEEGHRRAAENYLAASLALCRRAKAANAGDASSA